MKKALLMLLALGMCALSIYSRDHDTITNVTLSLADPCQELVSEEDQEVTEPSPFLVYPNPGKGIFTLEYSSELTQFSREIIVSDLQGRSIHTEMLPQGSAEKRLDLNHLPTGIYFLQLQHRRNLQPLKLVIF